MAESKRTQLTLRPTTATMRKLDALVTRFPVVGTRPALAHRAMLLGLEMIEDAPDALLREPKKRPR